MKRIFVIIVFWLAATSSGYGMSFPDTLITPNNLNQYWRSFSVLTKSHKNSVTFHITITSNKAKHKHTHPDEAKPASDIIPYVGDYGKLKTIRTAFSPYSSVSVGKVIHKKQNGSDISKAEEITPPVKITLKKTEFVWAADFTISRELLKNSEVYFSEQAYAVIHGIAQGMPAAAGYDIRLKDFVKH